MLAIIIANSAISSGFAMRPTPGTWLLAQLAAVKRRYNVDEDRVFLGGFSDGGSGSLIMGLYYPTPWAGLIDLSGSITVAIGAPDEAFPANLSNRPVQR